MCQRKLIQSGGATRNAVSVSQSTNVAEVLVSDCGLEVGWKDLLEGAASDVKQNWECSQVEDVF